MSLLFYIVAFEVYILCVHIWKHMVRNVLIVLEDEKLTTWHQMTMKQMKWPQCQHSTDGVSFFWSLRKKTFLQPLRRKGVWTKAVEFHILFIQFYPSQEPKVFLCIVLGLVDIFESERELF